MLSFLLKLLGLIVSFVTAWQSYVALVLGAFFPALVKKGLAWLGYEVKKVEPKV